MNNQIQTLETRKQYCKRVGISPRTLDHWLKDGKVVYRKFGNARSGCVRIAVEATEDLQRRNFEINPLEETG